MTRGLRLAGLVAFLAASALDPLSARRPPPGDQDDAPYVAISSLFGRLPNFDPLVDPYSFFLVRPWELTIPVAGGQTVVQRGGERSLDLPLDIQAMNFSGTIFLRAFCLACRGIPFDFSVIPNQISFGPTAATNPAAGAAAGRFAESVLSLGAGQASIRIPTASAVVRVSTHSGNPVFADAGSFLAVVEARKHPDYPPLGTGYFVVSQVVIMGDESGGDCPNVVAANWKQGDEAPPGYQNPDVLPLQQFLRELFLAKRGSPEKGPSSSGVNAPGRNAGWGMVIDKPPASTSLPISPTESLVRLVNPTKNLRSLVAVGPRCSITGNIVLNRDDPPGEIRISSTNTETIVLAGDGQALARFSQGPNFWTLFGGRRVTFTAVP